MPSAGATSSSLSRCSRYFGVVQGGDGALGQRLRRVGDDPVEVQIDDAAEPLARRAGADRAVVAEEAGFGGLVVGPADGAAPAAVEGQRGGRRPRSGIGPGRGRRPSRSSRRGVRGPRVPERGGRRSRRGRRWRRGARGAVPPRSSRPVRRRGRGGSRPPGARRPGPIGRCRGQSPGESRSDTAPPRAIPRSPRPPSRRRPGGPSAPQFMQRTTPSRA